MANLLSADLPSSDEEDENYDPTRDLATAQKHANEELLKSEVAKRRRLAASQARSRRGGLEALPELKQQHADAGQASGAATAVDAVETADEEEGWKEAAARKARQQRVEKAWANLHRAGAPARADPPAPGPSGRRTADPAFVAAAMRRAEQAAKTAALSVRGRVLVKETRNFAGKDVEVETEVDAATKAGARAIEQDRAKERGHGVDYVLQILDRKRRLNIVDKTRLDWKEYKRGNEEVQEELDRYAKGNQRHTERVDFLKRAEIREYERDRDARLASSARNRGRL